MSDKNNIVGAFRHKNTLITPTVVNRGNSVIFYTSKKRMTLSDGASPLYEYTVRGKSLIIESHTVKPGVEVGVLTIENANYEFLLQPAGNRESAIIINPNQKKVVIDNSSVASYFTKDTDHPKSIEQNNGPLKFNNYETKHLVYEALTPLSALIAESVSNQNESISLALTNLNNFVKEQRVALEGVIQKDFVKIKESQQTSFTKGWEKVLEITDKKTSEWFKVYGEKTNKKVSSELQSFARNLINEAVEKQGEELLKESHTHLASLSALTFKWFKEQVNNIEKMSDQLLVEKNEQTETELDKRIEKLTEQVTHKLQHLTDKVTSESTKIEQSLTSKVDKKTNAIDTLSKSLEKIIKETPGNVTELFESASRKWTKALEDKVTELETFKESIYSGNKDVVDKFNKLSHKVTETETELEKQKKTVNREVKTYIDKQTAEMKILIGKSLESGGGSATNPFINGGTMNGDLTVKGNLNVEGIYLSAGISLFTLLSGAGGGTGRDDVNTVVISSSANWNSVFSTVKANSAEWEADFTVVNTNSANWDTAYGYSTVYSSNSASYGSTYSTVNTNSASWDISSAYATVYSSNSAKYESNYSTTTTNSANWGSVYTTVNNTSANWNIGYDFGTTFSVISASYDSSYSTVNANSANWDISFKYSTVYSANSATYATIAYTANYLPLSGGSVVGDVTIFGNLTAYGTITFLDTQVIVASAMHITNTGTGPALVVNQTGPQPIADFQDDGFTVVRIADDGFVGIGTITPNVELTVKGAISATGDVTFNSSLNLMPVVSGAAVVLGAKSFYVYSGAGDITWTLPDLASSPNRMYFIKNRSAAGNISLNASGADNLYYTSVTPSYNVGPGEAYIIANDGTYWEIM